MSSWGRRRCLQTFQSKWWPMLVAGWGLSTIASWHCEFLFWNVAWWGSCLSGCYSSVWSCDVFGRTLLIAAETCKKFFHGKRREWMEKAKLIKIRKSGFQLGKVGSCLPINCCAGVQPSFGSHWDPHVTKLPEMLKLRLDRPRAFEAQGCWFQAFFVWEMWMFMPPKKVGLWFEKHIFFQRCGHMDVFFWYTGIKRKCAQAGRCFFHHCYYYFLWCTVVLLWQLWGNCLPDRFSWEVCKWEFTPRLASWNIFGPPNLFVVVIWPHRVCQRNKRLMHGPMHQESNAACFPWVLIVLDFQE